MNLPCSLEDFETTDCFLTLQPELPALQNLDSTDSGNSEGSCNLQITDSDFEIVDFYTGLCVPESMSMIMTSDNSTSDSNISLTNNNDTNIDGLKENPFIHNNNNNDNYNGLCHLLWSLFSCCQKRPAPPIACSLKPLEDDIHQIDPDATAVVIT